MFCYMPYLISCSTKDISVNMGGWGDSQTRTDRISLERNPNIEYELYELLTFFFFNLG